MSRGRWTALDSASTTRVIVSGDVVINNPPAKHEAGFVATVLALLGVGTVIYVGIPLLRDFTSRR